MSIPFANRRDSIKLEEYELFAKKWLIDKEKNDTNLVIINGWQADLEQNRWFAELHEEHMNTFAWDIRGQGDSIKDGRMDAVQTAIDADIVIGNAVKKRDESIILQGNCMGSLAVSVLYAGKFELIDKVKGVVLISPFSRFNSPWFIKLFYFMPDKFTRFVVRILLPYALDKIAPGDDSEHNRNNAVQRLLKADIRQALRQVRELLWKEEVDRYWKYIDVPALILVGDKDPLVSYEDSIDVYNRLKYPIWIKLEASDHLLLEENTELVSKIYDKFNQDPWKFYEKYKNLSPENSEYRIEDFD